MQRLNTTNLFIWLIVLLVLAMVSGLCWGTVSIPLRDVIAALTFQPLDTNDASNQLIIQQIRLPRILLAGIVGALLAFSGVAMQGLFRNALADPSLVGVTSGASLGASTAIVFGSMINSWFDPGITMQLLSISGVAFGAFSGGVISTILVYKFATNEHRTSVATMLLVGIAITAIASSINSLFEVISDDNMLRQISLWQLGGLNRTNYLYVTIAFFTLLCAIIAFPYYHNALDALLLGESDARNLGFDVQAITKQLIILIAFCVGVAVALTGIIGFIGLIIPHLMRLLIGPKHRNLLFASALAGAILLVSADIFSRTVMKPAELPVGVITALLGAPFFIFLLRYGKT